MNIHIEATKRTKHWLA